LWRLFGAKGSIRDAIWCTNGARFCIKPLSLRANLLIVVTAHSIVARGETWHD
jgi:hypothetical protein